jgi:uncharacterized protein (DUF305 family)
MKTIPKILSLLACCALALAPVRASDQTTTSLRQLKGAEFDQAFVSMMIEHHQHGVHMAEMAATRAQSAGVKQFASKTAQDQQKDIQELQTMAGSGGSSAHHATSGSASGPSHSASGSGHMSGGSSQQMNEMMQKLENAQGAEFDKAFVREMIKHHQMGVEMAELAKDRGCRSEVTGFAEKMVKNQKSQIDELKRLQK